MTTLNVSLSQALQAELGKAGVWAYAVRFDSAGNNPVWTPLVRDGVVENSGAVAIGLPTVLNAGKIYFVVQSQDPSLPESLPAALVTESTLNWGNAEALDFRYDSFEVSLLNTPTDAGNLTSVNGFGLPMSASVHYDDGTSASVGYGVSGSNMAAAIAAIDPAKTFIETYSSGPLQGAFRMAVAPTTAVGGAVANPPFSAGDWEPYLQSLQGPQAQNIVLSGQFNGAADAAHLWHNGGYFAYRLEWDATDGAFWLLPEAISQIKGAIRLTPGELANSIYSTLGNAQIFNEKGDATPFLTMNTGANNQWGKVLSEFLTGFTGGFYGETGKSANPQASDTVDLDNNINWAPGYAFGQNLISTPPGFMTSDPYSRIFYANSNSYGSGYSDLLMSQYSVGGPLIRVSEPNSAANVGSIDLKLFADGETPTGYTAPQIYDYLAPNGGDYAVPDSAGGGLNITLNFASAVANNAGVVLPGTSTITFAILTSDAGGTPVWDTLSIDGATAGPLGLWQIWNITRDGGGHYAVTPNQPPVPQPAGTVLLNGFPAASDGISWYRIGVGAKTFNLYTTTSGHAFVNPAHAGQAGSLAIDGLATITPQGGGAATVTTFSVNFAVGDTLTIDPSLLVLNTATVNNLPPASAPVAGTVSGDSFTALAGQTGQVTNTISTTVRDVAFSWTGGNSDPNTNSWISGFTNKIGAQNVARVTLSPVSGAPLTTTGIADLEGGWRTAPIHLEIGTYTVTMQEFLASDTGFTTPLTPASSPLVLTEAPLLTDPPCFAQSTLIRTETGPVRVEALRAGDRVWARGLGFVPVAWLGHRAVDCRRHPRPWDVWPVRVCRGAFGPGRPRRDLLLSPDHAVFVEGAEPGAPGDAVSGAPGDAVSGAPGMLVPVRYLVNGRTIVQEQVAAVTYWHVELPSHGVIEAEGLPCESYLDTGNRGAFANGDGAVALHPDFALRVWADEACAPLVRDGAALTAMRAELLHRAARLGHVITEDPALQVLAGGRRLVLRQEDGLWRAQLPAGTHEVRLSSRRWVPAETAPALDDTRVLGVAVAALCLDGRGVELDDPRLRAGWHAPEEGWRWTDGDAALAVAGAGELTFALAMTGRYWCAAGAAERAAA